MAAARLPFVAMAVVCAVLGVYLAVSSRDEARLGRASSAVFAGRGSDALPELARLEGEAGRRAAALRGYAFLDARKVRQARRAFQIAARRDPNNWVLQRDYAIVLLRTGERAKARARMRRALALNPRMVLPPGFAASR